MRGISINNDSRMLTSNSAIARATSIIQRSMERLATGQRINRASDDPAGTIAIEEFKGRIKDFNEEFKALELEQRSLAARDGAMSVLGDMFVELQSLVVASANTGGMSKDELEAVQAQVDGIIDGVDYLTQTAEFRGQQLLANFSSGNLGQITRPTEGGDEATGTQTFSLASLRKGGTLNLVSGDREAAQNMADSLVKWASGQRGAIGRYSKTLDSKENTLRVELENVTQAKSFIGDTDYTSETSELVRGQLLQQMSMTTRQIAIESQQETVLSLLKGAVKAS